MKISQDDVDLARSTLRKGILDEGSEAILFTVITAYNENKFVDPDTYLKFKQLIDGKKIFQPAKK